MSADRASDKRGDAFDEMVDEVLGLMCQAAAEVELSAANVRRFVTDAETLVRGLAALAEVDDRLLRDDV